MEILETEKFNALKELSEITMQISEARNSLSELESIKTQYLVDREKEVQDSINKILSESSDILDEVKKNFSESTNLLNTVTSYSEFLHKGQLQFKKTVDDFSIMQDKWNESINIQLTEIGEIKKSIKEDKEKIKRANKDIEHRKKLLEKEQALITSRQAQIKSALQVLEKKQHGKN